MNNEIDFRSNREKMLAKNTHKTKKKLRLKKGALQIIFNILSIMFVLGCCIFYGTRLIKYYKIFNPSSSGSSSTYLATSIMKETPIVTEGDGAYRISGNVIYKGNKLNNYVQFSNMLWRIVKINSNNTIELILDDSINSLSFSNKKVDYNSSDIVKYLNEIFIKALDDSKLIETTVCIDDVTNVSNITCDEINVDEYIGLLDMTTYLNSFTDNSYISSGDDLIWLSNTNSDKVWHTNGSSISSSSYENMYSVKPVITLNSTNILKSGTGTKEDPYLVEEKNDSIKIGSYIQLGTDKWIVYDSTDDYLKLELATLIKDGNQTYRFDTASNVFNPTNTSSLAYYLNNTYYNSLSYKDLLLDTTWYIGAYDSSYESIKDKKVTSKVGILSIADLKFDSSIGAYYLINIGEESGKAYLYDGQLMNSKINLSRGIRPTISIKKTNIKEGNGSEIEPFIMEV